MEQVNDGMTDCYRSEEGCVLRSALLLRHGGGVSVSRSRSVSRLCSLSRSQLHWQVIFQMYQLRDDRHAAASAQVSAAQLSESCTSAPSTSFPQQRAVSRSLPVSICAAQRSIFSPHYLGSASLLRSVSKCCTGHRSSPDPTLLMCSLGMGWWS